MSTLIDSTYDPLVWGSHLAPLIGALAASDRKSPVLELGVGHFSTPMLHAFCMGAGRRLVSVEANAEWHDYFSDRYKHIGHEFINQDYSIAVPLLGMERWGVAFIDNSPGGKRRADDFATMAKCSQYVVVHDYHLENEDAIKPLLGTLKWKKFERYQPPTLVVCNSGTLLFE